MKERYFNIKWDELLFNVFFVAEPFIECGYTPDDIYHLHQKILQEIE